MSCFTSAHTARHVGPFTLVAKNTKPASIYKMANRAHSGIPKLPRELVREILMLLSRRDICNLMTESKAFSAWGNALIFLEGTARVPSQQSLSALLRFQRRRIPLGLKVPHGAALYP